MSWGPLDEGRARLLLVLLTISFGTMAVGLYQARDAEDLLPWLWPWYFAAAATSTMALAVWLSRPFLFPSGVLVPIGAFGRVWASVTREGHRGLVAVGVYGALTVLTVAVWVVVIAPAVSWHQQHKGE